VRADTSNPCDRVGNAVRCERCTRRARFRREIPEDFAKPRSGSLWVMSVRDEPVSPRPRTSTEAVCEMHFTEWPYGIVREGGR
jgi:hypothetical protein